MASKTTKVTALIAAQVTGTDDVSGLADKVGGIPDKTTTTVAATVTGDDKVDGLATDIAGIPASTSAAIAATVTGDDLVDGLATDIAGLPGTAGTRVGATVTGDDLVGGLATDIAGLPASTDTKVAASVTGDQKLDALVKQLADTPKSTRFDVTANITETGTKGGIKQVGEDIDHVKSKAGDLATTGAGFASQFGGAYSNATGIFGDLAEQLSSIKGEAGEEGAGGALKGLGAAAAGAGATIIAGLAVDSIISAFGEVQAAQQEVIGVTNDLTQTLVDNGGAWDANAQRALIASVSQTKAFTELSAAGIDYSTIMDGLTGKAGGMEKLSLAVAATGDFNATKALKEANALSKVGANSRTASKAALDYAKNNGLLTDTQKAGMTAANNHANALDLAGDAAAAAGKDIAGITANVNTYNATRIPAKAAVITGDDSDATAAIAGVNAARIDPKVAAINGDPTGVNRTIADLGALRIPDKEARINAKAVDTNDAQRDIQSVADHHYEATITITPKFKADTGGNAEGGWKVVITPGMAPAGVSTSAAPSARFAVAGPAVASTPTYQINITGAIDADATARKIRSILDQRARRIGPTRLGRVSS